MNSSNPDLHPAPLAMFLRANTFGITIGDADAQVSWMGDSQLHSEPQLEKTSNMLVFITYPQIVRI